MCADQRADCAGGLHQWRLRAHAGTRGDAQERRGDQGSKRPHILRAAEDVDVVHEQLGVAGFPQVRVISATAAPTATMMPNCTGAAWWSGPITWVST